jgi:hypothetical protein
LLFTGEGCLFVSAVAAVRALVFVVLEALVAVGRAAELAHVARLCIAIATFVERVRIVEFHNVLSKGGTVI